MGGEWVYKSFSVHVSMVTERWIQDAFLKVCLKKVKCNK